MYSCPTSTKEQCYKTLVRPKLEYASTVWDPYTKQDINKTESVQNRAARFTTGDYRRTSSVTAMKEQLHWQTLQQRRHQAKVTMLYKVRNGLVAVPAEQYLISSARTTRGNQYKYMHIPNNLNV